MLFYLIMLVGLSAKYCIYSFNVDRINTWYLSNNEVYRLPTYFKVVFIYLFIFFYGNEHYTLNIKSTVTWHHDFYGCQGYRKKVRTKRKN